MSGLRGHARNLSSETDLTALEDLRQLADLVDFGLWEIGYIALVIVLAKIIGRRVRSRDGRRMGTTGDLSSGQSDCGTPD